MKVQTAPTKVELIVTGSIQAGSNMDAEEVADEIWAALAKLEMFDNTHIKITEGKTYDYK